MKPGSNGWTFDENAQDKVAELANTLRSVTSDGGMLTKMREGAVGTAQRFSLSNIAALYMNDFEEVLS
jgi:hypothetical protein